MTRTSTTTALHMARFFWWVTLASALLFAALAFTVAAHAFEITLPVHSAPIPADAIAPPGTFDPGASLTAGENETVYVNGKMASRRRIEAIHPGYAVPDGQGGYLWSRSPRPAMRPDPHQEAARELRLQIRELADQLFGPGGQAFGKLVAMPLSFVSQDDFQASSSLGRYLAEQLIYECNQRGVAVKEYRTAPDLTTRPGQGEFVLSRGEGGFFTPDPSAAYVMGTYYFDRMTVFLNARLVRVSDGAVLSTASLTLPQTPVTRQMLARTGRKLEMTYLGLKDRETMIRDTDITNIDLGEDLH